MAHRDPIRRVEIARRGPQAQRRYAAQREQRTADLAAYIGTVVDEFPPLTVEQRARLAALLLTAHRSPEAVAG